MASEKQQGRGTDTAKGQQKTYDVTNPTTGETRTVTQAQWREQKLGQQGFEKPADLDESAESGSGVESTDTGSTGSGSSQS